MSDQFWTAFFATLPALLLSFGTFITTVVTILRLGGIHKQINSRMDELLKVTAESAKALGIKEEQDRLK